MRSLLLLLMAANCHAFLPHRPSALQAPIVQLRLSSEEEASEDERLTAERKERVTAFLGKTLPEGTPVDSVYNCLAEAIASDDGTATEKQVAGAGWSFMKAHKGTMVGRDIRDKLQDDEAFQEEFLEIWRSSKVTLYNFLKGLGNSALVKSLNIVNKENKPCFFIEGTSAAMFRHEGNRFSTPPLVCLERDLDNRVFVMFTASGSGKTVDLAGSAYIRKCELTIYLKPEDDIELEDKKNLTARKGAAKLMLESLLDGVRQNNEKFFEAANSVAILPSKVAVAVDEASSCPTFVRALIADTADKPTSFILELLKDKFDELNIRSFKLSVGGTGASSGAVGSESRLCKYKDPCASGDNVAEKIYDALVEGRGKSASRAQSSQEQFHDTNMEEQGVALPSYQELQNVAPILHALAENNARLASIVVRMIGTMVCDTILQDKDARAHLSENESFLASCTIDAFIQSNGLEDTLESSYMSCLTGAQILAVHLFGEKIRDLELPGDETASQECLANFKYGIGLKFVDDAWSMKTLISKFGAVVPAVVPGKSDKKESEVDKAFTVDPAMQLVALRLLGLPPCRDALQPGFFGFEVTSVQMVRAAITATTVINHNYRPTVNTALKLIGFKAGVRVTKRGRRRRQLSDARLFKKFETVRAERHSWCKWNAGILQSKDTSHDYRERASVTYFQRSTLTKASNKASEKFKHVELKPRDRASLKAAKQKCMGVLVVDKDLLDFLLSFEPGEPDSNKFFPFASLSIGNSEYADGYVVFSGKDSKTNASELYTIAVQAKDYRSTTLDFKSIAKNVERIRSFHLSLVFGKAENRLVCVASKASKLDGVPTDIDRDFMRFRVDESKILGKLMKSIEDQTEEPVVEQVMLGWDLECLDEVKGGDKRLMSAVKQIEGNAKSIITLESDLDEIEKNVSLVIKGSQRLYVDRAKLFKIMLSRFKILEQPKKKRRRCQRTQRLSWKP